MSGKTTIEWTEHTWNPIVGCSIVSPGCTNCYAMKMAARIEAMGNQPRYDGTTRKVNGNSIWTGKLALAPNATLLQPLKRRTPTTYFVNSMGDLFHEDCPDEWIDKVFAVMALAPQHTFQVLTKRAKRMRDYFAATVERVGMVDCSRAERIGDRMMMDHVLPFAFKRVEWPLPNVWLGVSTERQEEANERVPDLLRTPATVRFVSAEPLLGHIAFHALNLATPTPCDALRGVQCVPDDSPSGFHNEPMEKLDWVIVGGESGHGARPMDPDWARTIRDWCQATDVPYFFKQWGSHDLAHKPGGRARICSAPVLRHFHGRAPGLAGPRQTQGHSAPNVGLVFGLRTNASERALRRSSETFRSSPAPSLPCPIPPQRQGKYQGHKSKFYVGPPAERSDQSE